MAFTNPPTAVTGAVVEAADINVFRDNDFWFDDLMPAPGGAGLLHVSASATAGTWTNPNGDAVLSPGTVTGNAGGSAIGVGAVHGNRLIDGTLDADNLAAESVTEPKLDADNAPTDGYVLSYVTSSGRMSWVSQTAAVAGVPSGLTAFFQTAMALAAASGWAAYTEPAGRLIACAGTIDGQTWDPATGYGSSWDHVHTSNTFTGSGSGSTGTGTSGQAAGPNAADMDDAGNGFTYQDNNHTHSLPSLSVSVSSVTVTGNTEAATYIPYLFALLMAEKS